MLKARVKISGKTVDALVEAAGRINTLLGLWAVLGWGNAGSGWWSYVTHGTVVGTTPAFEPDRVRRVERR